MRTIITALFLVAAIAASVSFNTSCSGTQSVTAAAGSAASCEGSAIIQVVKADGGTIVGDIIGAVINGGSALTKLVTDLIAEFGPDTVRCASIVADAIIPALAGGSNAPVTPNMAVALSNVSMGKQQLEEVMKQHGWL